MSQLIERMRLDANDREATSDPVQPSSNPGGPVVAAKTKTVTTYPAAAGAFYACETLQVYGVESEGSPATRTGQGNTFYAYNLGGAVPPTGTEVLVSFVEFRWVFRFDA